MEPAAREDRPHQERGPVPSGASLDLLVLHLQPVRLDLLGLVLKSDATTVRLAAESGAGKLAGNLLQQLARALGQLDLAPVVDEFTGQAQETLTSFAHLASGRKLEQGAEISRILAGMAGQKVKSGLSRIFRRRAAQAEQPT